MNYFLLHKKKLLLKIQFNNIFTKLLIIMNVEVAGLNFRFQLVTLFKS